MRNLKKILCVTVAVVMAFGLMTSGFAAGTNWNVYTDKADIKYTDAVSLLSALDILKGKPSGDTVVFDPKGDVKRSEVAKMIYVVLNNGYDDGANLYKNDKTNLTDINGHWAEGYIKYCNTRSIIVGMGDNTFKPESNVTGLQAYKMLLVALGYDPIKEGLQGPGWGSRTGICAQSAQLSDQVEDVDMSKAINREVTAQIFRNSLFATIVNYPNGLRADKLGDDSFTPLTLGWNALGLQIIEGVLVANDQVAVNSTHSSVATASYDVCDTSKSTIEFKVTNRVVNGSTVFSSDYSDVTINVDSPYTMVGKAVNAYVKVKAGTRLNSYSWISGVEKVYGEVVEQPGKNVVTTGISSDYDDDYLNNSTKYYVNYCAYNPGDTSKANFSKTAFDGYYNGTSPFERAAGKNGIGQQIIMISNDGNKSVEYVLGFDRRFGKITALANDKLSITRNDSANYNNGYYAVKTADIYNESELKLGDYAHMWKLFGTDNYMLEKPETVVGTLESATGSATTPKATISGKQYAIARDHINYDDIIASDYVGKELTYFLDGQRLCGVDAASVVKGPEDYLVVKGSEVEGLNWGADIRPEKFNANILTSNGLEGTYEIDSIYIGNTKAYMTDSGFDQDGAVVANSKVYYGDKRAAASPFAVTAEFNLRNVDGSAATKDPVELDGRVFGYSFNSKGKLVLYAPDHIGKASAYTAESAVHSYTNNLPLAPGTSYTKSVDDKSVLFIKSDGTGGTGKWYYFIGRKNWPGFTASAGINKASAIIGKFATAGDLIDAYAVSNAGYAGTGSTEKIGLILSTTGHKATSGKNWVYTSIKMFDCESNSVTTFTADDGVRVTNSPFKGSNVNAGDGMFVKYTLSGSKIDSMDFVDLETPDPGFYAGYISYVSGNSFDISHYQMSNGTKVGEDHFALGDAKLFQYDVDAPENSNFITEIPGQNPLTSRYKDGKFQYLAVVRTDPTKVNVVKNLFVFTDTMEYDFRVAAQFQQAASNANPAATITPASQAFAAAATNPFNVVLSTETIPGCTVDWSVDTTSLAAGIPAATPAATAGAVVTGANTQSIAINWAGVAAGATKNITFNGKIMEGGIFTGETIQKTVAITVTP